MLITKKIENVKLLHFGKITRFMAFDENHGNSDFRDYLLSLIIFVVSFIKIHIHSLWTETSCYLQQWHNALTGGGPWANYIRGPMPHFEFTEKNVSNKVQYRY